MKKAGREGVAAEAGATPGGATHLAQAVEGPGNSDRGRIIEFDQAPALEAQEAEKKYCYMTDRGMFSVQVKADGKGTACFLELGRKHQYDDTIRLKYLRYAVVRTPGGSPFSGPYYETRIGKTDYRILFSYQSEDVDHGYFVFYADKDDRILWRTSSVSRIEIE